MKESASLLAVMAGWAKDVFMISSAPALGHAQGQPFGMGTLTTISPNDTLSYPYFIGVRDSAGKGYYTAAAFVFIVTGMCTYLIMITRIVVGPAHLTSWMGQHIYLLERASPSGPVEDDEINLVAGYHPAPVERLFVQLQPDGGICRVAGVGSTVGSANKGPHRYIPRHMWRSKGPD